MTIKVSESLKKLYATYYEGGAESEWRRLSALDKAENMVSLCSAVPHDSVLEIGAGNGALLKRLSELGFGKKLYALEIAASSLQAISACGIDSLAGSALFDGYNIPDKSGSFDLAVLSHVVEHLEHPRQLIYEAARVANHVFIEVPLEHTVRMTPDFALDRVGHINFYSPKTIRRLAQSCGLEVLAQIVTTSRMEVFRYQDGGKGIVKYAIKKAALALSPRLATSLFTYHSALLCRPVH